MHHQKIHIYILFEINLKIQTPRGASCNCELKICFKSDCFRTLSSIHQLKCWKVCWFCPWCIMVSVLLMLRLKRIIILLIPTTIITLPILGIPLLGPHTMSHGGIVMGIFALIAGFGPHMIWRIILVIIIQGVPKKWWQDCSIKMIHIVTIKGSKMSRKIMSPFLGQPV